MTSEAWVAIIVATISVIGTVIATRFDDIIELLKPSRQIAGDWEGVSYLEPKELNDNWDEEGIPSDIKYVLSLSQNGKKVTGTMTMTEAPPGIPLYKHKYKGRVIGDYFLYEATSTDKGVFRISTAMLFISTSGKIMQGFFIANGGLKDPYRLFTAYTVMRKR